MVVAKRGCPKCGEIAEATADTEREAVDLAFQLLDGHDCKAYQQEQKCRERDTGWRRHRARDK